MPSTWLAERRSIAAALRELDDARSLAEIDAAVPAGALGAHGISVCLTGAPGVGKSSLIGKLVGLDRPWPGSMGVIAADPASRLTGGAVLADRVRLPRVAGDRRLYLRSMPTAAGVIPPLAYPALQILLARGFDLVVLETVGAGQSLDLVDGYCDILVLVLGPDFGDAMQLMKAGVLEAADAIVISKTDLGSHATAIKAGVRVSAKRRIPMFEVADGDTTGADAFVSWLGAEHDRLLGSAELRDRRACQREAELSRLFGGVLTRWLARVESTVDAEQVRASPWRAADTALARFSGGSGPVPGLGPD